MEMLKAAKGLEVFPGIDALECLALGFGHQGAGFLDPGDIGGQWVPHAVKVEGKQGALLWAAGWDWFKSHFESHLRNVKLSLTKRSTSSFSARRDINRSA